MNSTQEKELIYLHHPSAASMLADIIKLLENRDNPEYYCKQAVLDAKHDLAILETAGLYRPRKQE
jgi:hypothetical protein